MKNGFVFMDFCCSIFHWLVELWPSLNQFIQFSVIYSVSNSSVTMKSFLLLEKLLSILGIYPPATAKNARFISSKSQIILLCLLCYLMASLAFFSFKADSVMDYGYSIHMTMTYAGIIISFILTVVKVVDILALAAKFNAFFETSTMNFSWVPKLHHFGSMHWNFCNLYTLIYLFIRINWNRIEFVGIEDQVPRNDRKDGLHVRVDTRCDD